MRAIVWRIAAGDADKDLVPLMIQDGVMLIGPGSTGNIANVQAADLPRSLRQFRDDARCEHIVVLRLGSVCFSVGVIKSDYYYDVSYARVYSYWNPGGQFCPREQPWDLQHVRKVKWYGLIKPEALCFFRKGIYGGRQRFCRIAEGGHQLAKQELDNYLWNTLKYNNANGDYVLSCIGTPCSTRPNGFGFPTP